MLLVFFSLFLLPCDIYTVDALLSTQLDALRKLYDSLNGANWTYDIRESDRNMSSIWFNGVQNDPCIPSPWYGLTCSQDNTVITHLILKNFNLEGYLPDDVFIALNTSQEINLYMNFIYDQLPSSLQASSQSLTYLDVGSNYFNGTLPHWLGNLTQLRNLWVDKNNFTGSIPMNICQLRNINEFIAYRNGITGSIPACIGNMMNASVFQIYNNQMTGK